MALRLMEMFLPEKNSSEVSALLGEHEHLDIWHDRLDGQILVRLLLPAEETEAVLDNLERHFSGVDGFRIILLPVEATVPRQKPQENEQKGLPQEEQAKAERISREELYNDIVDSARISKIYIVMVILSSIVAAIGLLQDSVAVIIGAMVIAPLLGPNVALSLAATLGDMELALSSAKANAAGIAITLALSLLMGSVLTLSPDIPEIASRTRVGLSDVVLALASGSAGAFAFTAGVSATLIGVMVAVALLPPLVTFGMLLGSGYFVDAKAALLLFLTNLICVNLAGIITFLIQGIRPVTWWEAEKAKKATRVAIILWVVLLSTLAGLILLSHRK